MYGREGDELSLAAAGDAIVNRRVSAGEDDRISSLVDRIRAADVGVVNLETLLHEYEGYPAASSGGTYVRSPPEIADELAWMGFDLFAAANNHIGDYSHGGMLATMEALEERDLAYAGLGRNLAAAREPAYLDTPAGTVALVAVTSTYPGASTAGEQRPDLKGRPGVAPLELSVRYVVDEARYEGVRELAAHLGMDDIKAFREERKFATDDDEDPFRFLAPKGDDLEFEVGDDPGMHFESNDDHVDAVRRHVEAAAKQADWVVVSVHAHEGSGGNSNDHSVPAFLESFAHTCVDAGADAVVGHGPHVLRAIEVYEGAPVFYSLGNFFYETRTITKLPAEMYDRYDLGSDHLPPDVYDELGFDEDGDYRGFLANRDFWESVVPVCEYVGGELDRVELHPIELGLDAPRSQRGRPFRASADAADRIFKYLTEKSDPYGTSISVEDGVGIIEP